MDSISKKTAAYLREAGAILPEQEEAYAYTINSILEFTAIALAITLTAIFSKTFLSSLTIVLVVVSLRTFCGGAHTSGSFSCFIVSYLTYLLVIFLGSVLADHFSWMILAFSFPALVFISAIGPVESGSGRLNNKKRKKYRVYLIINSCLILTAQMIFFHRHMYCFCSIIFIKSY